MKVSAMELRVGNFVMVENDDEIVAAISESHALCRLTPESTGVWQNYEHIRPIPITEEWLKRGGYTRQGENGLCRDDYGEWEILWNKGMGCYVVCNENAPPELVFTPVFSVHQLQNLYFALVGSELTLDGGE